MSRLVSVAIFDGISVEGEETRIPELSHPPAVFSLHVIHSAAGEECPQLLQSDKHWLLSGQ